MKPVILAVICVVGLVTSCPIIVNIGSPDMPNHVHTKDDHTHPTANPTHQADDHTYTIQYHTHPTVNHTHSADDHTHPSAEFIAFSVGTRKGFTSTSFTRIPMEVTLYNPNGHFRSDNAFYAPVKGVYSFTFSGTSARGKDIWLELFTQKPGASKVSVAVAFDEPSSNEFGGSSASVIITMDAGESASVWLAGHSRYVLYGKTGGPSTLFSGKLEKKLD